MSRDKQELEPTIIEPALNSFSGFCPVAPVPKGRPRFARQGKFVKTYTPKETEDYENAVRKWMQSEYGKLRYPMDGALYARYEFVLPRPKSKPKKVFWSDTKPDIDNFIKSFQDGLDFKRKAFDIELGVIANDSRIASISATKRYAFDGERPGTNFSIFSVNEKVIVYSPAVSDEAMDALDSSLLRIPIPQMDAWSKTCCDTELIYVVLAKETREEAMAVVESVKQSFPSLKKVIICHF